MPSKRECLKVATRMNRRRPDVRMRAPAGTLIAGRLTVIAATPDLQRRSERATRRPDSGWTARLPLR